MPTELLTARMAEALLNGVWQSCVVAAGAEAATRLMRGVSAHLHSRIWSIALSIGVLLPALNFIGGAAGAAPPALWQGGSGQLDPLLSVAGAQEHWRRAFEVPPTASAWLTWLVLGLSVVGCLRVLALFASATRLRRLKRTAAPLPRPLEATLAPVLARFGRRGVTFGVSHDVGTPSTLGFRRPVVLIPKHLLGELSVADWQRIALHELAHVRRFDDWANLLERVAERLFFFLPGVVWAARRSDLARELACDEFVVSAEAGRRAYAECLTRVAIRSRGSRIALAAGATGGKSQLARRVELLVDREAAVVPWTNHPAPALAAVLVAFAGLYLLPELALGARPFSSTAGAKATAAAATTAGQRVHTAPREPETGDRPAVTRSAAPSTTPSTAAPPSQVEAPPSPIPLPKLPAAAVVTACDHCDGVPHPEAVRIDRPGRRTYTGELQPKPPTSVARSPGPSIRLTIGVSGGPASAGWSATPPTAGFRNLQRLRLPDWLKVESRNGPVRRTRSNGFRR